MNINKYIDWAEIWDNEIDVQTSIDCLEEDEFTTIEVLNQFKEETDLELLVDECIMEGDNLIFFFSESGGQNESDMQGWSRDYILTVNSDFTIVNADYSQG